MGETSLPVPSDEAIDAGDRRQLERRNEDRRKMERIAVRSLLALLLAGAAAVLGAIALWLQFDEGRHLAGVRSRQQIIDTAMAQLRAELATMHARADTNAKHLKVLDELMPRVDQLEGSITELRGRVDAGRRAWTLAETRYLLEVANRGLTLERDVSSALAALEAADARLKELRDPGLNQVRKELARELQSLRLVPQPDLTGIAAQLASAEELAARLPVIGAIPDRYRPESTETSSAPGFARAWQLLRSSLTNMISIRRIGKDAVELVSLEEQNVRRQHLQLLLFAARLATVRGDNVSFHANIDNAAKWLAEMFDPRGAGVANVNETLRELAGVNLAPPLPEVSQSLRMLDRLAFSDKGAP
jgi:uroporphyrin-III C-methyltransferase